MPAAWAICQVQAGWLPSRWRVRPPELIEMASLPTEIPATAEALSGVITGAGLRVAESRAGAFSWMKGAPQARYHPPNQQYFPALAVPACCKRCRLSAFIPEAGKAFAEGLAFGGSAGATRLFPC